MKLIRDRIDAEVECATAESIAQDHENDNIDGDTIEKDILTSFEGHVKLGAPRSPLKTIQEIRNKHASQPEFQNLRQKFTDFVNQCLPVYLNHDPNSWVNISFLETFQVCFANTKFVALISHCTLYM